MSADAGQSAGAVMTRGLTFDVGGDQLVGVLHDPVERTCLTGVVVVVGGPQYRVGSHRQFLQLAREVAASGVPVLRFDCRGMGDSEGEMRTFEALDDDIAGAIEALQRETGVEHVVLWGLCDGASAAMMYAWRDARVTGLALLNPWVQDDASEAKARVRHYYASRVFNRDVWRRFARGEMNLVRSAKGIAASLVSMLRRPAPATLDTADSQGAVHYIERMRDGWSRFEGDSLLILSGNDLTAAQFEQLCKDSSAWGTLERDRVSQRVRIDDATHTFSRNDWKQAVAEATVTWLRSL